MPLKKSHETFLKGAATGALLMDLRRSIFFLIFGFFFLSGAFFMAIATLSAPHLSGDLESIPLQTPEDVEGQSGLVKIQGVPSLKQELLEPITLTPVLYYHTVETAYQLVPIEKTRTIQEDGQTRTEPYFDYEAQWVAVEDEEEWADFSLGAIAIEPDSAQLLGDFETLYDETSDLGVDLTQSEESLAGVPQQRRLVIEAILPDEPVIVAGLLSQNVIRSGSDGLFVLSNKTEGQMMADQKLYEETTQKAGFFGIWFMLTLGLFLLCMPFLRVVNILPGLGILAAIPVFATIGLITGIAVYCLYLGVTYWWLLLPLAVVGGFALRGRSLTSAINLLKFPRS